MRRREFVGKSLAVLTPTLLADVAFAQEVKEAEKRFIEVPGLGKFSLDPEDYDADSIANLFGQDFAGGVAKVRQKYDGAVRAIASGDKKQLAKLAEPLVARATRATELPLVGSGIKKSLLDTPKPETISKGRGATGAVQKTYFVNGMFTTHATAQEEAGHLAKQLPKHAISLFYNEGADPRTDSKAAGKDLEEALKDRVWPIQLTRTLRGKSLGDSLKTAVSSTVDGGSPLQHNPTTRQLAGLIYKLATEMPTATVSLVGYSQGAMIVRNALYTVAILGHQEFVEKQVAFVALGSPINDYEVWPLPKKFTPIIDPQDPIPSYFGLNGSGFNTRQASLTHHYFEESYVKRVKPEMLTL